MKISVIIPVYNVERYVARCLDSVLAAAVGHDVEIICVNDGSSDGSADVLARYADRVRIIEKTNGGPGSARNCALDVMCGDYVMFVDSDDWIPADAISVFSAVARESGAALVVSTSFCIDAMGFGRSGNRASWRMRKSDWISGKKVQYSAWNKLYRSDLFRSRRYQNILYEDFPVTTDIFCEVGEFAAIDKPLYVYCTNAGGTSITRSAFSERKMRDSIEAVRAVLKTSRRQVDPQMRRFALNQADDGHSSTVGQVFLSNNKALADDFLSAHDELLADYPELKAVLSMKARFRLWRMR